MSIEYFIFFDSDCIEDVLKLISSVNGIEFRDRQLHIEGMLFTECDELDQATRAIMREEFGPYGLKVNWRICGTYDRSRSSDEVLLRLFQCVAVIINMWPERNASLMRDAESFYIVNTGSEVLISSMFMHEASSVSLVSELSLIKKTTVCREM